MPGVRSAVQFPIPDPALTRGRVFSGGVAVVADTWYQAKTAIDKMPIEWDDSAGATRRSTRANMREALLARARPARHGARRSGRRGRGFHGRREDRRGDLLDAVPAARPHGAGQRHGARRRRPRRHLDRRSEPAGNALQRGEDHRDSRDQRPPAPVPPGRRLRPQRQRPAGRARDHDRQRAPRHADPSCCGRARRISSAPPIAPWAWRASKPPSMPTAGRSRSRCGRRCRKAASVRRRRST